MTRTIALVRAAIGVAATIVFTWACDTPKISANPRGATGRDSAEQVMYGGKTVLAFNGLRRGDVGGDTVLVFDAATRFEFEGVRAQFMSSLGRPLSLLTAATGTYRIETGAMEAHGKVTIASDTTRRRLEGVAVRFDIAKNQFSSDSAFTATSGARKLSGVGFTADPGLFAVKCVQRCTGSLGP